MSERCEGERTILITGGSGKIGRVLVAHFLDRGDAVVITSQGLESRDDMLDMYSAAAAEARLQGLVVDLTATTGTSEVVTFLDDRGLRPKALINNARNTKFLRVNDVGMVERDDFQSEILLDVIAPYELAMALTNQEGSRLECIVNITSMYGVVAANPSLYDDPARDSPIHYGIAKSAQVHLTKELAVRLAGQGVRVNAVSFGGVEGRVDEAFKARYASLVPIGRMLREDDIAGPVEFLLSDGASGMSGHNLIVDGGWTVW